MDVALRTCKSCRKLFVPRSSSVYCPACENESDRDEDLIERAITRYGLKKPRQIADWTGLPLARVKRALRESRVLAHAAETDARCARCGERPVQKGSDYCLSCRLDLQNSFRDSATDLSRKLPERPAPSDTASVSAVTALSRKRRRTGTYRFNPAPAQRKGYR
jgi:hypothetical protein